MTNRTDSQGIGRGLRLGTVGLVSAIAVIGGSLGLAAAPASAATPSLAAGLEVGGVSDFGMGGPDFSYTSSGVPMARNVGVGGSGFGSGATVYFDWSDATVQGPWTQAGSAEADRDGVVSTFISSLPASVCGHTIQIQADYLTLQSGFVPAATTTIVDDCGPEVWLAPLTSAGYAGVAGDGFTPGGQVALSGKGPKLSTTLCTILHGRKTCVTRPWMTTATATPRIGILHCGLPPAGCYTTVLQAGGDVSVAFPRPVPTCTSGDSFLVVDLSTGVSVRGGDPGCLR